MTTNPCRVEIRQYIVVDKALVGDKIADDAISKFLFVSGVVTKVLR